MAMGSPRNRGRLILLARFLYFFMDVGLAKSFGILIPDLEEQLDVSNAVVGFITSLSLAAMYIGSPIAQLLLHYSSHPRLITSLCGLMAGLSIIGTAFTRSVVVISALFLSMGFCCSIINFQAIVLLHQYYRDDFPFISCISVLGIPVGAAVLPPLTETCLEAYGLGGTLMIIGAVVLNLLPIGMVLIPRKQEVERCDDKDMVGSLLDGGRLVNIDKHTQRKQSQNITVEHQSAVIDDNSIPHTVHLQTALNMLRLDALIKESIYSAFFLPGCILLFVATGGWALFIVVYGLSHGLNRAQGAHFATSSAVGGVVSSVLTSLVLRKNGLWGPPLYLANMCIATLGIFFQTLHFSFLYLLVMSFVVGFGLFGANVTVESVMIWSVSTTNFAGASNLFLFSGGLGFLLSGYIAGSVADKTDDTKLVFLYLTSVMVAAIMFTIALIVCTRKRKRKGNRNSRNFDPLRDYQLHTRPTPLPDE